MSAVVELFAEWLRSVLKFTVVVVGAWCLWRYAVLLWSGLNALVGR